MFKSKKLECVICHTKVKPKMLKTGLPSIVQFVSGDTKKAICAKCMCDIGRKTEEERRAIFDGINNIK